MSEKEPNELWAEYQKPLLQRSKFWLGIVMLLVLTAMFWIFKHGIVESSFTREELKAALEIFEISSQWTFKEKVVDPDFTGVILVPEISFRVRNVGRRELRYVYFLGVFRFLDTGKTIGEGYRMTLRQPLPVGAESKTIVLKCAFGYRASSLQAFEKFKADWQSAFVDVFAESKNSGITPLKTFYISRKIEGLDIEVKVK